MKGSEQREFTAEDAKGAKGERIRRRRTQKNAESVIGTLNSRSNQLLQKSQIPCFERQTQLPGPASCILCVGEER